MNVLADYTKNKRFVNGFEDAVQNEIRKTREYQDFVRFFSGQTLDVFISNRLNEEGMLEVQVSRLLLSKRLELCDRLLFTLLPEEIEPYEPTSPAEIAVRRILNQDAFRSTGEFPRIRMECELYGRYEDKPEPGAALYTAEDREQLTLEIARNQKFRQEKTSEGKLSEYLEERERIISEAFRKVRNNEILTPACFSIGAEN